MMKPTRMKKAQIKMYAALEDGIPKSTKEVAEICKITLEHAAAEMRLMERDGLVHKCGERPLKLNGMRYIKLYTIGKGEGFADGRKRIEKKPKEVEVAAMDALLKNWARPPRREMKRVMNCSCGKYGIHDDTWVVLERRGPQKDGQRVPERRSIEGKIPRFVEITKQVCLGRPMTF